MSKKKGDFVEQIVAELHQISGVTVTRNARLRAPGSNRRSRGRDIDVLLEAAVGGYEVQFAIECKNERKKIGAPKIDGFAGKLREVGIPTRNGIFVSTSGFTSGALQSAAVHCIRTLVLTGVVPGSITDEVGKALCSSVYLMAEVKSITVTNDAEDGASGEVVLLWVDGRFDEPVPSRIARHWIGGAIPSALGIHEFELPLATETHQMVNGRRTRVFGISCEIEVLAFVLQVSGSAVRHGLVNTTSGRVEKLRAVIKTARPATSLAPLLVARTEGELSRICTHLGATNITSRVLLPRVRYGPAYWPLSKRAMSRMAEAARRFERGEGPQPSTLSLVDIEGENIAENFRPDLP